MRVFYATILSLLAHAMIFGVAHFKEKGKEQKSSEQKHLISRVRILPIKKEDALLKPRPITKNLTPNRSLQKPDVLSQAGRSTDTIRPESGIGSFFPTIRDFADTPSYTDHKPAPYRGKAFAPLRTSLADFGATLDIPLVVRRTLRDGRADALLRRDHEGQIMIVFLIGTPILRSVLWEQIMDPKSQKALHRLFDEFDDGEIRVGLVVETKLMAQDEFVSTNTVFDHELEMRITHSTSEVIGESSAESTDIPLLIIDEENAGKKARLKDVNRRDQLKSMEPYRTPVFNRKVPNMRHAPG